MEEIGGGLIEEVMERSNERIHAFMIWWINNWIGKYKY